MNSDIALIITLGIVVLTSMTYCFFEVSILESKMDKILSYDKHIEVFAQGIFQNNASGVYFPNCGFFVDTRGRNIDEINKTLHHEGLHAILEQYPDKEHFCKGGN